MEETTSGDSPLIYIPFDVIRETILCKLPVNSLLRFRCVCNSWNSLISNDLKFAMKHLRVSPKRQHLVTTDWRKAGELSVTSRPFNSLNLHSTLTSKATQLDYPIIPDDCDDIVASCDGILCFVIDDRLPVLYNPCIRKVKQLPDLPRVKGLIWIRFAFGYDPFIDNYKVVAVSKMNLYKTKLVHSYTLGTDSWERIKDFPLQHKISNNGVFVSGTVNWLTRYDLKPIVSLHLGTESYQEISLPDFPQDIENRERLLTLDVISDCLCLFSQERYKSSTDVWLMKEYGNKDSWIKLISLPYFGDFRLFYTNTKLGYICDDDNQVLLAFQENRSCTFEFCYKFKWDVYDLENKTIKSSEIHHNLSFVKSKVYVESLISP